MLTVVRSDGGEVSSRNSATVANQGYIAIINMTRNQFGMAVKCADVTTGRHKESEHDRVIAGAHGPEKDVGWMGFDRDSGMG